MKLSTTLRVNVPAKAMLWGEYGVLLGGAAVVATLPNYRFRCEFEFFPREESKRSAFSIESNFFDGGEIFLSLEEVRSEAAPASEKLQFFWGIAHCWLDLFENFSITLRVLESFSPSLGCGSSSALVAACSRAFCRMDSNEYSNWLKLEFWRRLRETLKLTQGGGSGYDVMVQCASLSFSNDIDKERGIIEFWKYRCNAELPVLSSVSFSNYKQFGVLLASGVYHKTAKVFSDSENREAWSYAHAMLAERVLSGEADLSTLMTVSRNISTEQGLMGLDNSKFAKLCAKLNELGVPWKTMGAGYGDCVWIAAPGETLCDAVHPVSRRLLCDEIVFDFSQF